MTATVISVYGHKAVLDVDPHDHIGSRIARRRMFYERDLLEDLRRRVGHGLAVDVGAHIGNHTIWMAKVCGLDVVALEPHEQSRRQLVANVARNRLAKKVTVHAVAAGNSHGAGRIRIPDATNSGMVQVLPGTGHVPIVPIDSLNLTRRRVAVMKIDVEGAALPVLEGAAETIARDLPILYVETDEPDAAAELLGPNYERRGKFCATPTWLFTPRRDVTVSVAIMAHPSRAAQVDVLTKAIDGPVTPVFDRKGDRWDTGRRSLLAADPSATHHLVVQDDVTPAKNLRAAMRRIAAIIPPDVPVAAYMGRSRVLPRYNLLPLLRAAKQHKVPFMRFGGPWWGQAVLTPTSHLQALVAWGDQHTHIRQYDHRMTGYWDSLGIDCWYTAPSLVQHLVGKANPSLLGHGHGAGRTSAWAIDGRSALSVDWDAHAVTPADLRHALRQTWPPSPVHRYRRQSLRAGR